MSYGGDIHRCFQTYIDNPWLALQPKLYTVMFLKVTKVAYPGSDAVGVI